MNGLESGRGGTRVALCLSMDRNSGRFALLLSLAACFLHAIAASGATINVGSLSSSAVQTAINSASAGDTIVLPSGSATWTATVVVNRPVTIKGAGIDVTTIVSGGSQLFNLLASSKTQATRITGLTIDGGEAAVGIGVGNSGVPEYGVYRIDHCRIFHCTMEGVVVNDIMAGVIDHCTFSDNYLQIGHYPGLHQDHSWQLPVSIGTTNCTVVEDCVFLHTAGGWMPFRGSFENGQGARLVIRNCNWTNFATAFMSPIFDAHGNQGVVDTVNNVMTGSGGVRGTRNVELYNNVFNSVGGGGGYKVYYRGGVLLTFSNRWYGSGLDTGWRCSEEDGTSRFNLLSVYPGYDQHWMWSWGNTQNGTTVGSWYSAGNVNTGTGGANDSTFIVNGLNVFWTPPSAVAAGYPVASPPITSYTPLVYPHPLVVSQDGGTPGNSPPTAVASGSPTSGVKPLTVNFNGSASSDPERTPLTFSWNFGDGQTSTSANPSHIYSNAGNYAARLTVSDGTNSSTATVSISVLANANGLVAAYGFEEASGTTVLDSSGNSVGGYMSNTVRSASGRYGKGITFGGASSMVVVPENSLLDITGSLSIEAWVKPTAAGTNWQNVVLKGGPNTALSYILNAVGMPSLDPSFFVSPASSGVFGPVSLPINAWTHLAGTYDGATMKIYTNGVLAASVAQTGTIAPSTDGLFIGGNPYYGHNFIGTIDEVRIYNRALSAGEVQTDMNTPLAAVNRPLPPPNFHVVSQ